MIVNTEFENAGDTAADAAGWTRVLAAQAGYAGFQFAATGVIHAREDFSWEGALTRTLVPDQMMQFDLRAGPGKDTEDFEDLWGARNARLLSKNLAPFILQPGQTLNVSVNGADPITVVFEQRDFANIADARAEEVARVIDRAIAGADAFMSAGGRGVVIATTAAGYSSTLAIAGGTAATIFDFPASARGSDEEGGSFFRRAEYNFRMFGDDPETALDAEAFEYGFDNPDSRPDLRSDPYDGTGRLQILAADPFIPDAFRTGNIAWTMGTLEVFESAGFPDETLTTNFL